MNTTTETNLTTANFTRGVCILQHVTAGDPSAISCGQSATHIAFHTSWGRGMECCEHVATDLLNKANRGVAAYQVYAWDSLTSPTPIPAWVANYISEGGQA